MGKYQFKYKTVLCFMMDIQNTATQKIILHKIAVFCLKYSKELLTIPIISH